jgi:hypothetical protein
MVITFHSSPFVERTLPNSPIQVGQIDFCTSRSLPFPAFANVQTDGRTHHTFVFSGYFADLHRLNPAASNESWTELTGRIRSAPDVPMLGSSLAAPGDGGVYLFGGYYIRPNGKPGSHRSSRCRKFLFFVGVALAV